MLPGVGDAELRMTDAEFRMFVDLVRDHCGLYFAPETRFLLERRLVRRLLALELRSFTAYHWRVRNSSPEDDELANLVDELTTNETYFFRQIDQLRALVHEIFAELKMEREGRGGGPISVWCAGCSSGEEPYSLVMLARDAGLEPGRDLRVYGSDISRRMLRKARSGIYREASFRETDESLRERYFSEKDGQWRIADDVRRHVDFMRLNLLDRSAVSLLGSMDVILCRNVIIYFDAETTRRVIQTFFEKLKPGGHLLLGHSESLVNLSNALELRHVGRDLVYRRPVPGGAVADPRHAAAFAAVRAADAEPEGDA